MEYFTTPEQEVRLQAEYQRRRDEEQDRLRQIRSRPTAGSVSLSSRLLLPPDRLFFVEPDGRVYLGEVKPENECPSCLRVGGASYGIDTPFLSEVQAFIARHSRYMVVFQIRSGYSPYAGIYPARMVSDREELLLERDEQD